MQANQFLWIRWCLAIGMGLAGLAACGGGDGASTAPAPPALLKAAVSTAPATGSYWVPSEPGSGFFFEAQGAKAVLTFFAYAHNLEPIWYTASGDVVALPDGRYEFAATLNRYNMAPGWKSFSTPPVPTAMGTVKLIFSNENVEVQVPGRTYRAEKFVKAGQATPQADWHPPSGIYWDPKQNGRGFVVEVVGGTAYVTVYTYDETGTPKWFLVGVPLDARPALYFPAQPVVMRRGGQPLGFDYRPPILGTPGYSLTLGTFGPCQLRIDYTDGVAAGSTASSGGTAMSPYSHNSVVEPFNFGGLPPQSACRYVPQALPAAEPSLHTSSGWTLEHNEFESLYLSARGGAHRVSAGPAGVYTTRIEVPSSPATSPGVEIMTTNEFYPTTGQMAPYDYLNPPAATSYMIVDGKVETVAGTTRRKTTFVDEGVQFDLVADSGKTVLRYLQLKHERVPLKGRFADAPQELRHALNMVYTGNKEFLPGAAYWRVYGTHLLGLVTVRATSTAGTIESYRAANPNKYPWSEGAITEVNGARCWYSTPAVVTRRPGGWGVCELRGSVYEADISLPGATLGSLDSWWPTPIWQPYSILVNQAALDSFKVISRDMAQSSPSPQ